MNDPVTLTLSEDEIEVLIDALEADLEGYVDAIEEAREQGAREDVKTFTEAADRIRLVMAKLSRHVSG